MFPFLKKSGRTWFFPVLLCGLFLLSGTAVQAGEISRDPVNDPSIWSLSDTLSVTAIGSPAPSPSGRDIAYVVSYPVMDATTSGIFSSIYTVQSDGSGTRQLTSGTDPCSNPAWSPEGRRIAYISYAGPAPQVWIMNSDGSGAFRLTSQETGVSAFSWSPDGKQISYRASLPLTAEQKRARAAKEDPIVTGENLPLDGIYLIPADGRSNPDARLLTPMDMSAGSWDWLPDSSGIVFIHAPAALERYSVNTSISRIDLATGRVTLLVPESRSHATCSQVVISPDGKLVAYPATDTYNLMDISIVPVRGGTPRMVIADFDQGATGLGITGWSADGTALYVPGTNGTEVTMNSVPVDGSAPRELFRYGNIASVQENRWRSVFVYIAEESDLAPELYITPVEKFVPFQVTRLNANLKTGKIGKTEVIRWISPDGNVIEGVLTYPVNYTPGTRYPLIIEAHGGPSSNFLRYFTGGTSWPIIPTGTFSSLGYAVLHPNIRGSNGYGPDFVRANYADWGGGDYRDLIAGADYLVDQGIADPDRMGIIGQSYGGYMAAWTVTQTPRFKGAVVIDGITDLVGNAGTTDVPFDQPDLLGGEYWEKWDLYTSRSPIHAVANVSTPTLIVSGEEDVRVPPTQAQAFSRALWKRGIPSQLVIYPRAGHFPGEPKQIRDLWAREIRWMNAYVMQSP